MKTLQEIKDFMSKNSKYPSCSFHLKINEYNEIANLLTNHFTEIRIQVKEKREMPFRERVEEYSGKYVILTISK